jgi:hypothetical protein
MKKRLTILLPSLAIALGAAVTAWATISTDFNHQADFSRYHTYSWIGVRAGNTLWQDRIMTAVDGALGSRG